jgi:hypothetical protein
MEHGRTRSGFEGGVSATWNERGLRQHLGYLVPLLLAIALWYVFLASAGTFHEVPGRGAYWRTAYYDKMAEGFRSGHLYLREAPARALLETPNPFLERFVQLGLWDASLYNGHYYFYWGPVPALLLLAFKTLSGHHEIVMDQWLVLLFTLGRLCAGALLLLDLSRVRHPEPPRWLVALAIAVFGLAGPTPYTICSPNVYEASLMGGQCFLLWGLWFALRGLLHPERRQLLLLLAGLSWALAIGSRITMLIVVPSAALLTLLALAWQARSPGHSARVWLERLLRPALALGLPALATVGAYGWYNYARFGSPTDFGVDYQISPQWFWTHEAFVLPNVFSYLFAPLHWSCRFPFATSMTFRPLSRLISWPPGYQLFEKVSGVLVMGPWCYFGLLWPWRWAISGWRRVQPAGLLRQPALGLPELWAVLCSLAILPAMLPALGLWEASARYAGDALSGALIASSLAAFWLYRRATAWRRALARTAALLVAALGLYTCFVGAFSGFASNEDPILVNNPALYHWMVATLSFCPGLSS